MQIKRLLYKVFIILFLSCNQSVREIPIEKPPEIYNEIESELENSKIPEHKKRIILEKVKQSEDYGKKSYSKIDDMEKRIKDLETSLSLFYEENKRLKKELEYYQNIEKKIITAIFIITTLFFLFGLFKLIWKFRHILGIPL